MTRRRKEGTSKRTQDNATLPSSPKAKYADSAYFSRSDGDQIPGFFAKANSRFARLKTLQRRCFADTLKIGDELRRAKRLVKAAGGNWLDSLADYFDGGVRNAQDFMFLSRNADKLQPLLAKNPNLSKEAALQSLRKPKPTERSRGELWLQQHLTECRKMLSRFPDTQLGRLRHDSFWMDVERFAGMRDAEIKAIHQGVLQASPNCLLLTLPEGLAGAAGRAADFAAKEKKVAKKNRALTVSLTPGVLRLSGEGSSGWYQEEFPVACKRRCEFVIAARILKYVAERYVEVLITPDNRMIALGRSWQYVTLLGQTPASKAAEEEHAQRVLNECLAEQWLAE